MLANIGSLILTCWQLEKFFSVMRGLEEPMIYQTAEQTFLSRGTSNIYVLIGCTQFSLLRRANCKWRIVEQAQPPAPLEYGFVNFPLWCILTLWDFHVFQTFCWKEQMINGCSSTLSLVFCSVKPSSSCTWQNLAQVVFVIAEEIQALKKWGLVFL